MGGLGFTSPSMTAFTAFCASISTFCHVNLHVTMPSFDLPSFLSRASFLSSSFSSLSPSSPHDVIFVASVSAGLNTVRQCLPSFTADQEAATTSSGVLTQRQLAFLGHKARTDELLHQLDGAGRQRLQCLSQRHVNDWAIAIPSVPELLIPSRNIPTVLSRFLGTPFPHKQARFCICKRHSPLDTFGQHLLLCPSCAPQKAHDSQINHVILPCARESGAHTSPAHSLLYLHDDANMVPDARIDDTVIDFEQVNPCAPSHQYQTISSVVEYAENAKSSKHAAASASASYHFVPFVVTRYGSFGKQSLSFFNSLISNISPDSFIPPNWAAPSLSSYWFQRFSVCLQSNNASESDFLAERCLKAERQRVYFSSLPTYVV